MDQREYVVDWEETIRTAFAGLIAGQWHAMPGILVEDSSDGHNAVLQIPIKRMVTDPVTGERSYESHPIHPDTIVHFPGGARAVLTHGLAKGDEGLIVYANRDVDAWRHSGGEQIPVSTRMSGYQDPHLIPGIRSDPRKLQQVDTQAAHLRSEDKLHVHEMHPDRGHRTFSADPSTAPASPSFDPLSMATKFIDHAVTGGGGLIGRAVSGGTQHTHGVNHDVGSFMTAMGGAGLVQALAHPDLGGLLSSADGAHIVQAHPEQGVMVQSATAVTIQSAGSLSLSAPPGVLSLPSASIGGASLTPGAAASNVGALGGDLSGTLPNPQVTGLGHVAGQDRALVQASSDSAAAYAGVAVGSLYVNTAVKTGVGILAVRLA